MNLRRIIPTDITASAIAHLSLLALLLVFSDVHPFGAVATESIPVEIVAPQDIPDNPDTETKPEAVASPPPLPDFTVLDKPALPATPTTPAASAQQPPPPPPAASPQPKPQKQAAVAAAKPAPQPAASQPATPLQQSPAQQNAAPTPAPAYQTPEPDLTLKYNVLLGLPPNMSANPPPTGPSGEKSGYNFDSAATQNADVASSVVTAFRQHLRSCSKLVAGLKTSDEVKVKLRVFLSQDGKLAAEPLLIEASASMKGPLLMQSAIKALQACQPYAMLPLDRYGEWKVLDLNFTPQEFSGS